MWAEALDGGDWKVKVPQRDKVMLQKAPFTTPAVEIARTEQRFVGFAWTEQRDVALLHEYDENRHWRRTSLMDVDHPQAAPRVLWDLSSDEKYADPGQPGLSPAGRTASVLIRMQGDAIYLSGTRRVARRRPAVPRPPRPEDAEVRAPVPQRPRRARALPGLHRRRTTTSS